MPQYTVNANGNYPDNNGLSVRNNFVFMTENPSGATAKLQAQITTEDTSGTEVSSGWVDLPNGSFTAADIRNIQVGDINGVKVRVNVASYASNFFVYLED